MSKKAKISNKTAYNLYKQVLKNATERAVDNLQKIFMEKWQCDGTINGGDFEEEYDEVWEDEIYND